MSKECKDFIKKLLDKKAETRLGTTGDIEEILAHPWLSGEDQEAYLQKAIEAPYVPQLTDDWADEANFAGAGEAGMADETIITPQMKEKIDNAGFDGFSAKDTKKKPE